MVETSGMQIPPPKNWQDFETLCWDLWKTIWNDLETVKNGRQGQKQNGVDVYGRPAGRNEWAGIQCKGKDNYSAKTVTENELRAEVEKAKTFEPKLTKYILATTGQRDQEVQKLARKISEEHEQTELFSVNVFFWDDIQERLIEHRGILERHYKDLFLEKPSGFDEIEDDRRSIINSMSSLQSNIEDKILISIPDFSKEVLDNEYQAELVQFRELIKDGHPSSAIKALKALKDRIWLNTTSSVRYRILTNQGAAYLDLHKYRDAGRLFVKALQYNSVDEKAIENAAFGYLLLGDLPTAKKMATEVLKDNPTSSRAYFIIIQAISNDGERDIFISDIPDYIAKTQDVAYVIGNIAHNKGDLHESKKWLEIAIENEIEDTSEIKAILGSVLLELVLTDPTTLGGHQLNQHHINLLTESVKLCTFAWEKLLDSNLQKLHVLLLVIRGIAKRLLDDSDGCENDIRTAFNLMPQHPKVIYFKALSDFDNGKPEKTINPLKEILLDNETPDALFLYIEALKRLKKSNDAIVEINSLLKQDFPPEKIDRLNRILIELYLDISHFDEALDIAELRVKEEQTSITKMVDLSHVLRMSGKIDEADSTLFKAKDLITESSPTQHLIELADDFFGIGFYEESARTYEKFVDIHQKSKFTYKIVYAYYQCGEIGQALEICTAIQKKFGHIPHFSQIEFAIYNEIGNLPQAKIVCQEYVDKNPNEFGMKLNLAVVNLRCNNLLEVGDFLNSSIDLDSLSIDDGTKLANLFYDRGLVQNAIKISYELRLNFFKDSRVHLNYIWAILNIENEDWLYPTIVEVDTVVWIEQADTTRYYILENNEDVDIIRNELSLNDELSQKMLGKSVGDKFTFNTIVSEDNFKITKIMSKYVFAFQESRDQFNQLFPRAVGLWKLPIEKKNPDAISSDNFEKIKDLANKNYERNKKISELYAQRRLTIGAIAGNIQINVFDIWVDFTKQSDLGIYCAKGSSDEREQALNQINDVNKLIVDPISLATMIELSAGNLIINNFGKLGIAQSTIDSLQEVFRKNKGISSKGFMSLVGLGENVSVLEVSAESIQKKTEKFEGILDWVRNNCEIIPCDAALKLKRSKRDECNGILGQAFMDTILIASQEGNILYSDDALVRAIAKDKFNVEGVWTQILLMGCLDKKVIDNEKHHKMVVDLVNLNYHHTSVNSRVVIEAAKQANWNLESPFINVLNTLIAKYSDELSAFRVSVDFTSLLWKEQINVEKRDWIFWNLLTILTTGRWAPPLTEKFKSSIINQSDFSQIDKKNIIELIELWDLIFWRQFLPDHSIHVMPPAAYNPIPHTKK